LEKTPTIDRKTLKNPDEFQEKGRQLFSYVQGHLTNVVLWLGIGVAVVTVYFGWEYWHTNRDQKSWAAYQAATKEAEDKKVEAFKGVYEQFSSVRAGYLAGLAIADHYFNEAKKEALKEGGKLGDNPTKAIEWYGKALNYSGLVSTEKQLIHIDRGTSFELDQKYDQALEDYKKASELEGYAKGLGLLNQGRIYELKKDEAKAIESYQKVTTDYSESEYAKLAKNNLRRMKSALLKSTTEIKPPKEAPKKDVKK
jgi:hypothetical protein